MTKLFIKDRWEKNLLEKKEAIKNAYSSNSLTYKIQVMQACQQGAVIESRPRNIHPMPWMLSPNPMWDWVSKEYRVRP